MIVPIVRRRADGRARRAGVAAALLALVVPALGAQGPWRVHAEADATAGRGAAALGAAQWLLTGGGTLRVSGPVDAGVRALAAEARDRSRAAYGAAWLAVPVGAGVAASATGALLVGSGVPDAFRWDAGLAHRWRPGTGMQLDVRLAAGRLARTLERGGRETGGGDAALDVELQAPAWGRVRPGVGVRAIGARRDVVALDAIGLRVPVPVPIGEASTVRVVDVTPALRWVPRPRLALDLAVTTRVAGQRGGVRAAPQASLDLAVGDGVTVMLGAGEQLADPRLLLARVRWASAGVRLAWRTPGTTRPLAPRAAGEGGIAIEGGTIVVVVPVTVQALELRGDFTDWTARPCTRTAPARMSCGAAPAPGAHRVALRTDGGPWRAPSNLPVLRDDFGAEDGDWLVPAP